ncbi:E3 ubiquitin-protein ligase EL5-like [Miscanthus floridulus]|uniref:E3 ubiquitin-protein ligase EL5-like n=1 Tax=Miscanthus floridulus TaxID=154761 RepID=UPI0034597A0B
MTSLRAALLLLPPFSVVVAMAARCLCRVMARKLRALARSQLACLPSGGPSFPYLVSSSSVEDIKGGGGGQLPVALYSRRTTRRRCVVGEEEHEEEECVFCLSGIEEGSEVRELRCRHLFHRACLDRWVRARPVAATCPLCRGRLLASPPWEVAGYYDDDFEEEGDEEAVEDSDMMLLMACVHSSSSWLWPS